MGVTLSAATVAVAPHTAMTPILLAAVGVALTTGLLRGGSLDNLLSIRFRAVPALMLILFVQIDLFLVSHVVDSPILTWIYISAFIATGAWIAYNAGSQIHRGLRVSLAVIAAGWLLNAVVILVNGGMPVVPHTDEPGQATADAITEHVESYRTVELTDDTRLPWLSDVIEIPSSTQIISPGDALLTLGIAMLVGVGTQVQVNRTDMDSTFANEHNTPTSQTPENMG
jgi:hypothetical protein